VAVIGFVEGFWKKLANLNLENLLKQVNPCFEVEILLENLFNLADASP